MRRTKIVTTLGPATDKDDVLEQLILAGANVARLNFSHGSAEDHKRRADAVREIAAKHGKYIAILGDLQGPKIRIARFRDDKVTLEDGQTFILDVDYDKTAGDNTRVGIDYPALAEDSKPGDVYLLDDGRVKVRVEKVEGSEVHTTVTQGGPLSNNKGINKLGGGLSAKALTEKDKEDIKTAAEIGVDYIAVSFPRSAEDMNEARQLLAAAGATAELVAKLERAEATLDHDNLDRIILASDVVMVARGDLGVEIGDPALISVQKHIIKRARTLDRVVITATQMMESMIDNPFPTRAEVFDVANAVLDGTDAVMCSAETAAGAYPVETVKAMHDVCLGAEKHPLTTQSRHRVNTEFKRIDETIAMSVMYSANHLKGVKAIIALTESGSTPRWMSRISSGMPIYAMTRQEATQRRVALYRGVEAIPFDVSAVPNDQINRLAVDELKQRNIVKDGDLVLLSYGDHQGVHGGTNTLKIVSVGNIL
ncbi:pyruvate kinase [Saccharospirillum salsuginis]|uniref:Pyruvate kinase n=1 Tax=Saccharospirillum salsuginis TaxID=418750 RepID=A0A918JZL0_9GAMM|nr:pyruvate kinase [Saccharospirillum salsuginis]GGX39560.1 pyruvate kinase [Saccharospirillum salsuginis]